MKMKVEKKKNVLVMGKRNGDHSKKTVQKPFFPNEEEVDNVWMLMDDSSKYSVKLEEATWTELSYPFASNQLEIRDFIFYLTLKIITDSLLLKLWVSLNFIIFLYA